MDIWQFKRLEPNVENEMHINILELGDRINDLVVARSLIEPDILSLEADLLTQKWFDYRFLSPLRATILFGERYRHGLRNYIRTIDIELVEKVRGVRENLPPSPVGWFTQLWKARQRADQLLLPYDEIIEFGFWFVSRRRRRKSPLPLQLFANEKTAFAWNAEFAKFKADRALLTINGGSDLPAYQMDHDIALPAQTDYRNTIRNVVATEHRSWTDIVGYHCLTRRHLPLKEILMRVPAEFRRSSLLDALAQRKHDTWGKTTTGDPEVIPLQSCFGLFNRGAPEPDQCRNCPVREDCIEISDVVEMQTERKFGSPSPVVEARRAKGRARVKKFRASAASTALKATVSKPKGFSEPVPF